VRGLSRRRRRGRGAAGAAVRRNRHRRAAQGRAMKLTTTKVIVVAVAAGLLGVVASLMMTGPGPFLGTEAGQRLAHQVLQANAPPVPEGVEVAKRGGPVPRFDVAQLDGGQWTLPDDFSGRPVLVNIWASWCPPCIEEMPELDRFAR